MRPSNRDEKRKLDKKKNRSQNMNPIKQSIMSRFNIRAAYLIEPRLYE